MSEVPKFVRHRLAQQSAEEHPDANVLSAFAEGSLSGRERTQVVAHLSACAACRETVALALPEVPAPVAQVAPGTMRWARWPMLRWAGVAAAVVVVAAAVVVQNSRRPSLVQTVRTEPATAQAEPKQAEAASAPTNAPAVREDRAARKKAGGPVIVKESQAPKAEANADKKKDALGFVVGGAMATAPQANRATESQEPARPRAMAKMPAAPPVRPQASPQPGAAGSDAAGMAVLDQAQRPSVIAAQPPAASTESVQVFGGVGIVPAQPETKLQAKTPMRTRNSAAGESVFGPAMAKAVYSTGVPRWRISAEGTVERSLDSGQTWRRVAVANHGGNFQCLAAVDDRVWVGGTGGTLYQSADNGRTWQRVAVRAGDATLEADITRVEFTDVKHGAVTTASGENWTTADGGATWSLTRR